MGSPPANGGEEMTNCNQSEPLSTPARHHSDVTIDLWRWTSCEQKEVWRSTPCVTCWFREIVLNTTLTHTHLPRIKLQMAVRAILIFWKDPNKWIFLWRDKKIYMNTDKIATTNVHDDSTVMCRNEWALTCLPERSESLWRFRWWTWFFLLFLRFCRWLWINDLPSEVSLPRQNKDRLGFSEFHREEREVVIKCGQFHLTVCDIKAF